MDQNNSDQDQTVYPANSAQDATQQDNTQTPPTSNDATQLVSQEPTAPSALVEPTGDQQQGMYDQTTDEDYIEDLGEDLIDFLDDMEGNENLLQNIASDMGIEKERARSILTKLLDKIDQEQISTEELALIITAIGAGAISEE